MYSFGVKPGLAPKGCVIQKGDYFKPDFYDDFLTKSTHDVPEPFYIENNPRNFKWMCPHNRTIFHLSPEATEVFNAAINREFNSGAYKIRMDGKIIFRHVNDTGCNVLDPEIEHFCIDGAINYGNDVNTYHNKEGELVLFSCLSSSITTESACSQATTGFHISYYTARGEMVVFHLLSCILLSTGIFNY